MLNEEDEYYMWTEEAYEDCTPATSSAAAIQKRYTQSDIVKVCKVQTKSVQNFPLMYHFMHIFQDHKIL